MICANLKVKMSVYFVLSVFSFYLRYCFNRYQNQNKQMNTDAFELQEIKRVEQSFYVLTNFILAAEIVIYLPFVIINGKILK